MEKFFMSAGLVSTIVLCLVGIIKMPFKKFKANHKNLYKTIFTLLSYVLAVGLAIVDELFILSGKLLSVEFAFLIITVIGFVTVGYNLYEGTQLKTLVGKIVDKMKQAKVLTKDKKVVKYLDKAIKCLESEGIDKAISILEQKKISQQKVEEEIIEDVN